MSMMGMTGLLIAVYFSLIIFVVVFLKETNTKIVNLIFIILNVIFFLGLNVVIFKKNNSFRFMVFENISPFTFTFIALLPFMKDSVKQYFKNAIAFLCVGMVVAMMITPQYAYLFSFRQEAGMDYLFDALCHLNCSLFGIYLVVSGQVKLDSKSFIRAVIFMYVVITSVVILNFIFHTNNFGMCPYGGYSIYMFNLFEDYAPTLTAYYLGVLVVLYIGFEFNYALNKINGLTKAFIKSK
jgi:hypothetical protein